MNKPSPALSWDTLDWTVLDWLRDRFLAGGVGIESYWKSPEDLANYDFTFGQRIGWKWDAVLQGLRRQGWTPLPGPILDWGCGSGVAGRRVVRFFQEHGLRPKLQLFDRSELAIQYATEQAKRLDPQGPVEKISSATPEPSEPIGTLVISHVLNELDEEGGRALRAAVDRAHSVLWVEPGTFPDSRALIAMREALREKFHCLAPCTHQAGCGLLTSGNERHWCHHFAQPPPGLLGDAGWVRFGHRAGIDLRRLPYSYLVLERKGIRDVVPGLPSEGYSRLLGAPRVYKGFAKLLSCQATGVEEFELQKRVDPALFKSFRNGEAGTLWHWTLREGRIVELKASPDLSPASIGS